jgi:hypothetical protein
MFAMIALTLVSLPVELEQIAPPPAAEPACYQLSLDARGEARYAASLLDCDGNPAIAEEDIRVVLTASPDGEAVPSMLVIRKGESSSDAAVMLKAAPGWEGEIAAKAVQPPGTRILECAIAHRMRCAATGIEIGASSLWAQADGRHAIVMTIRFYREEGGRRIYLKPGDENADTWIVHFTASNSSVRFGESDWPKLVILRDQYDGSIKLHSDVPIGNLRVTASAINANGARLTALLDGISFGLPWLQLLLAGLAGAALPLLLRQPVAKRNQRMALGAACAIVLFLLLFFGAVAVGRVELGGFVIDLRQLPLGNWLAACLVGLLAGAPIQGGFLRAALRGAASKPLCEGL